MIKAKRNKPVRYQALFFDFDGVLVESTDIKYRAFRTLYQDCGNTVLERVLEYLVAHEGISRVEKIHYCHRKYLGIDLSEADLAVLTGRYAALVKDAVVDCDAVAGAEAFLEAHVGKSPVFVVSGTPEPELIEIVERRGMGRLFTSVHGSPRLKGPIVWDLLHKHGLNGSDCLFVGDAMTDCRAAAETGLSFIGRVGEGDHNPFPDGTTIIRDLSELSV